MDAMMPVCSKCKGSKFNYDDFEDMYRCVKCEIHWYPAEVGVKDNETAGYKKITSGSKLDL